MVELKFSRVNGTVVLVLALFLFIYTTTVFCVLVPWLEFSVPGVTQILVLSVSTGLALYCFLACVVVDPGRVPDEWGLIQMEAPAAVVEVKKTVGALTIPKTSGTNRWCQKCRQGKPPRSHHCRHCGRCVLRMDHHCPWMNNCIGHANYRAFLLFLLYTSCALVQCLVVLMSAMVARVKYMTGGKFSHMGPRLPAFLAKDNPASTLLQGLALLIVLPLALGLVVLLGWNVFLLLQNKTTIEYREGVTARIRATQQGSVYSHPYNLGCSTNLQTMLGPHVMHWFLPLRPAAAGSGLSFPTAWDNKPCISILPPGPIATAGRDGLQSLGRMPGTSPRRLV